MACWRKGSDEGCGDDRGNEHDGLKEKDSNGWIQLAGLKVQFGRLV